MQLLLSDHHFHLLHLYLKSLPCFGLLLLCAEIPLEDIATVQMENYMCPLNFV